MTSSIRACRTVPLAAFALFSSATLAQDPATPPPEPRVEVVDLVPGTGREAGPGMELVVHYTGWLLDPAVPEPRGRQFDSSRDRGRPIGFVLGAGRVIPGWELGCAGMRVGGLRRLTIPPGLGYGSRGAGNGLIPPDATLLFEIELLAVGSQTIESQAE